MIKLSNASLFSKLKPYFEAVDAYLVQDSQKINSFMNSDLLNAIEKKLIDTRLQIRSKEWVSASEILNSINTEESFYLGEKYFLLANIAGFNANWEDAIEFNQLAITAYSKNNYNKGLFLSYYNLSADYSALGLFKLSLNSLKTAEELAQTTTHKVQLYRAQAWSLICQNQNKLALETLDKGFALIDEAQPSEQSMFQAVASDIYFRTGHKNQAFEIMKKLKYSKNLRDKSRIHFEFTLLEKLTMEKPPYTYLNAPTEDIHQSKEYTLKWNCLKSLIDGDKTLAEKYWKDLCLIYPLYYSHSFQCQHAIEEKSIFICFLNSVLNYNPVQVVSDKQLNLSKQQQKLVDLLQNESRALSKVELIEKIWETPYSPDMDAKFYKLVQRLKQQYNFEISHKNQIYFINLKSS